MMGSVGGVVVRLQLLLYRSQGGLVIQVLLADVLGDLLARGVLRNTLL